MRLLKRNDGEYRKAAIMRGLCDANEKKPATAKLAAKGCGFTGFENVTEHAAGMRTIKPLGTAAFDERRPLR